MEQPMEKQVGRSVEPNDVELDPMTVRLLAFVRRKGGPSEVARRIGIKPSVFYNYESGRNKQPSSDILKLFVQHYEDFDPVYILTGKQNAATSQLGRTDTRVQVLEAENTGLRKEISRMEQTISILLQKDIELGKSESANESTQGKQLNLDLVFDQKTMKNLIPIPIDYRDALGRSVVKHWRKP